MTIQANNMTYTIISTSEGYDVRDVSGTRPVGLRDAGPWSTEEAAAEAIRNMTPEQAAE